MANEILETFALPPVQGDSEPQDPETEDSATTDDADVDTSADDSDGDGSSSDDADAEASSSEESSDAAEPQVSGDYAKDASYKGDGKTLPKALKSLIGSQTDPKMQKFLKDLYFTNHSYRGFGDKAVLGKMKEAVESFGGVEGLIAAKEKIDLAGGIEGIEQLQSDASDWQSIDKAWMEGDPELASRLQATNPEAFDTFLPNALVAFGTKSPEAYDHLMSQVIFNTQVNNGTITNLTMLEQALNSGNVEQAKQFLGAIKKANENIQRSAMNGPAPKRVDPKVKEYEDRLSEVQQQKQEMFLKDVNASNNQWIDQTLRKEVKDYLGRDLSQAAYGRIYEATCDKVRTLLSGNDSFMKRREVLMQKQDKEGLLRLWKEASSKLWAKALRDTAREFEYNPKAGGAKKTATSTQSNPKQKDADAGWEKTTKYPKREDVNDKHEEYYKWAEQDKFLLKNGKKIQVVPN